MSFTVVSRLPLAAITRLTYRRLSGVRSRALASRAPKPRMLVSGVRSSWVMLAMNSDFTFTARSASTVASRRLSSRARRAVMSRITSQKPTSSPVAGSRMGASWASTQTLSPDLQRNRHSSRVG